ncbi:hypothetical protein C3486_04455 [Streptomyces sp. Ru73]|uniref:hypothetical protein n=1 Tax=Streptomyces sp. Ru73 TaxID=2080748 RepID=UPI000CDDB6CE|nr:hypothetical protein [Streptomyces sp. Ru73]POX42536.1 hypothetical protein C3486_04455 [Streptomyces sp. Ru73]
MAEERRDEAGTDREREARERDLAPAQKRGPAKRGRDRSAEEVNADQPSQHGERPAPARKHPPSGNPRRTPEQ